MQNNNNSNAIQGVTPATLEVFDQVSKMECIKDLFLCGGTGQSLQMNHRLSEDLDFELLGVRKDRPALAFGAIINELKHTFADTKIEILGEDHFLAFINDDKVKLSFYRPDNPVQTLTVGWQYNNIKVPTLQELFGMKIYTICLRLLFRDYYDIYCLLEEGCNLDMGISYASYLSRHSIRSKTMYSRMLSPQLFIKDTDFLRMSPRYDVSSEDICARIKKSMEK